MAKPPRLGFRFRWNVLSLVGAGYGVTLIMFVAMAWSGEMNSQEAYNVLEGPLMALIGGPLAIAKDLIAADSSLPPTDDNSVQEVPNNQQAGQDDKNRKTE